MRYLLHDLAFLTRSWSTVQSPLVFSVCGTHPVKKKKKCSVIKFCKTKYTIYHQPGTFQIVYLSKSVHQHLIFENKKTNKNTNEIIYDFANYVANKNKLFLVLNSGQIAISYLETN